MVQIFVASPEYLNFNILCPFSCALFLMVFDVMAILDPLNAHTDLLKFTNNASKQGHKVSSSMKIL